MALVLLLSAIGCAGSSSRPEEFTGAIAFVGYGDRIFTVDAADSKVTRIGGQTSTGAVSWSPDGATIAYSTPDGVIKYADSSGGGERRLGRPAYCLGPIFSPDGARLACDYTEPWILTVLNAGDGSVVARTADGSWRPSWSPDGRQIVYVSFGTYDRKSGKYVGFGGVFVMNADGTHKRRAGKKPDIYETPAWSSRGMIAFIDDAGGIWAVNASGKGLRRLVPEDRRGTEGLAWSPDGTKLAFSHGDGDYEVFVVNANGTGLTNLTNNEKIQDKWPSWSPDGKAIAFVSDRVEKRNQVFVMRADGSGQTQLTDDRRGARWNGITWPAWSPAAD
jgi:Tol biopolymer transport system component